MVRSSQVLSLWSVLAAVLFCSEALHAVEPVWATIELEEAWVGQAVPMVVTLYSTGPFSGAPSFDLPEIPQTAILKMGNAIVGSEEVDGESVLTQRHEFHVFTQRTGTLSIPPFVVRFQGQESFVGEAVAKQGKTPALSFQSSRPPETSSLGIIVATPSQTIEQEWTPVEPANLQAGDVIQRTITRRVENTSAMMLPPAAAEPIEGVRIYNTDPIIEDTIQRGVLSAQRVDTIKYQFERSGSYKLPDITFAWWDPEQEKLQQEVISGQAFEIAETIVASVPQAGEAAIAQRSIGWIVPLVVFAVVAAVLFALSQPLRAAWSARWNSPARTAERRMLAACNSNDASAAYSACMAWQRTLRAGAIACAFEERLGEPWKELRIHLYSGKPAATAWNGHALRRAFLASKKNAGRHQSPHKSPTLPPLNP